MPRRIVLRVEKMKPSVGRGPETRVGRPHIIRRIDDQHRFRPGRAVVAARHDDDVVVLVLTATAGVPSGPESARLVVASNPRHPLVEPRRRLILRPGLRVERHNGERLVVLCCSNCGGLNQFAQRRGSLADHFFTGIGGEKTTLARSIAPFANSLGRWNVDDVRRPPAVISQAEHERVRNWRCSREVELMLNKRLAGDAEERELPVDDDGDQTDVGRRLTVAVRNGQQAFFDLERRLSISRLDLQFRRNTQRAFGQGDAGLLRDVKAVTTAEIVDVIRIDVAERPLQEHPHAVGAEFLFDVIDHRAGKIARHGPHAHQRDGMARVVHDEGPRLAVEIVDANDADRGIERLRGNAIRVGPEHRDPLVGHESPIVGHVSALERTFAGDDSRGKELLHGRADGRDDFVLGLGIPRVGREPRPVEGIGRRLAAAGPIGRGRRFDHHAARRLPGMRVCGAKQDVIDFPLRLGFVDDSLRRKDDEIDGNDGYRGLLILEHDDARKERIVRRELSPQQIDARTGGRGDLDLGRTGMQL